VATLRGSSSSSSSGCTGVLVLVLVPGKVVVVVVVVPGEVVVHGGCGTSGLQVGYLVVKNVVPTFPHPHRAP
jgi:hypothetical protein